MKQNNYSFTDIYFSERWMSLKNLPNEEWMDIKGYEGIYMVSNMGRVKVLDRLVTHVNYSKIKESHILSPNITGSGIKVYLGIHLWLNGNRKCKKIHRLVAEHFIDNPEKLPCINHKNEDKFDNRVENLEWCTYSYNNTYNNLKERTKPKRINKATMSYPVLKYDKNGVFIAEYPSYSEAARVHNVPVYTIRRRCDRNLKRGVNKPSRDGYIWVRKDGVKLRCNRKNYE